MLDRKIVPAIGTVAIPPDAYWQQLEGKLQAMALNDNDELKEIARHRRGMERDVQKSLIRQSEFNNKQLMKARNVEFCCSDNQITMQVFDGMKTQIEKRALFSCRIEEVKRYERSGTGQCHFQLILREHAGGVRIFSRLYDINYLLSPSKLQKTELCRYDRMAGYGKRATIWKWLSNALYAMYEKADVIIVPSKCGWHETEKRWKLWSATGADPLMLTERMKRFSIAEFEGLELKDVVEELLQEVVTVASIEKLGLLFICRMTVLLGRVAGNTAPGFGVTIFGRGAMTVAKTFLSTMCSDIDVVNLDSDRLGVIRERAESVCDTPLIAISAEPGNRSTQNRMNMMLSWMDTGYIEGTQVTAFYVFCIREMSKEYPMRDMLVIDAGIINTAADNKAFAKFQSLIVCIIEDSGEYWVNELRKTYARYSCSQEEDVMNWPLFKTVVSVLMRMLDAEDISGHVKESFYDLLRAGENEIYRQLSLKGGVLLEFFRESVKRLADESEIVCMRRDSALTISEESVVYFDGDYYYFTKKVFSFICRKSSIDDKSKLFLKQSLLQCDAAKTYRNTGNHSREMDVDFLVSSTDGQKVSKSGFAVEQSFWDEPGGIRLWERGH